MTKSDVPERWVDMVLAADGGNCHGFGRMHCFDDPVAKWQGRRCPECHDWAREVLRPVLADLRRQVEALVNHAEEDPFGSERSSAYATVLHLLDTGGSDE